MVCTEKNYDVIVIGGGLSGLCAAISSARNGAFTALVQNRPQLGGNASSEIRMHICGADNHGHRDHARETGILEELLLENRRRNPGGSYSVFDTILWEKARFQSNLDLYLNTHISQLLLNEDKTSITKVMGIQLTTEKEFQFNGKIFVDATGDGSIAALAGAKIMLGREGKETFKEPHAPDEADHYTMGNTLLFKTINLGYPVPFIKPSWANNYSEDDLKYRDHGASGHNYWWIEIGGDDLEVIGDGEIIRDELLKAVYGVWDHIKNKGDHGASHYDLDWIGFLPGKRESRRIVGDYILNENDLATSRIFNDAVAYGGWPMDMHVVGGIRTQLEPTEFIKVPDVYTIPYRSLYSKDINNLYIGGRCISASHMAFGSTRVMGTCAVIGQGIGTAAAYAISNDLSPKAVTEYIDDIQQILLRQDAYIPGFKNTDSNDMARQATVTASSQKVHFEASNVINGTSRSVHDNSNCWATDGFSEEGEWLELAFDHEITPTSIEIKFDSNLSKQIMLSMFDNGLKGQEKGIPKELVKDYRIELYQDETLVKTENAKDNYLRFNVIPVTELNEKINRVRIHVESIHGIDEARIFEVRIY